MEYLEANLYIAVSGQTALSSTDTGSGPAPLNAPTQLTLDTQTQMTAAGLANDELHHIELLRGAITQAGGTPIAQPQIDYSAGAPCQSLRRPVPGRRAAVYRRGKQRLCRCRTVPGQQHLDAHNSGADSSVPRHSTWVRSATSAHCKASCLRPSTRWISRRMDHRTSSPSRRRPT